MKKLVVMMSLLWFVRLLAAAPDGVDLHEYWDQRCQGCHGHAGQFARRFLHVDNGMLLGTHHRTDLGKFLRKHYLTDELVAPVTEMLVAQATTVPLFGQRCSGCHGTAADFARKSLAISNGHIMGLSSGRKVTEHLASHGGLTPEEVSIVVDSLTRVRGELAAAPGK